MCVCVCVVNVQGCGQSQRASVMKGWDPFLNHGMVSAKLGMLLTHLTVISESNSSSHYQIHINTHTDI